MTATVRKATLADRFALVRMGKEFLAVSGLPLPVDAVHMEATAKAHITDENRLALLLEVDGGKHGMLLASVASSPLSPVLVADETVWWIDQEYRGQGRLMLDAYEAWATEKGASLICMHAPNERVGLLYRRRGYVAADVTFFRGAG